MARKVRLGAVEVQVNDRRFGDFWDRVEAGKWEPTTIHVIQQAARGTVFIDIGGWIGPTVLAGAPFAERVVVYEPDPVAGKILKRNIQLNGFANVDLRERALCDRKGEVPFGPGTPGKFGQSESSMVIGEASMTVPAVDAKDEVTRPEFASCGLMKIDVEGAEFALVPRMSAYFARHRPVLLLSLHHVEWPSALPGRMLARLHGRLREVFLRVRLLWVLRRYRFAWFDGREGYLGTGVVWKKLSVATLPRLVFGTRNWDLLFSDTELAFAETPATGSA